MDIFYQAGATERTLLKAHLYFDFVFKFGAYGGVLSLLMMARNWLIVQWIGRIVGYLAVTQLIAWGCDIIENLYLMDWIANKPDIRPIFSTYHFVVIVKRILVLSGAFVFHSRSAL